MAFVIDDFDEELGEELSEELSEELDEELGEELDEEWVEEWGEEGVSELDMLIKQTVSDFFDRKLKWISFYL